jgi:hypothetical protein
MDQPREAFIVMGTTGEYSDRTEWPVIAYFDRASADKHADAAMLEAKLIAGERSDRYTEAGRENPHDRDMKMSYTGTDYYVLAVPVARGAK